MDTPPSSSKTASAADDIDQTIKVRTPVAGATYFNRYRLTRILGRGGMGVVWLADDLKLERPVALKFLPSLIGLDPTAVKELKIETRRGLELSHPNIVRIYDFVDDADEAAISMEFVDGKTLSELRSETDHGVFTAEQVAKWLPGVCDALDYAHFQRKVVHRDLKPSNIMAMSNDATAKIADFGIARSISDTMQRLSISQLGVSGTLPYMSPQQAMGERPAPTDDVYSLGATIYELLSGKPPFYRGDIPSQLTSKIPSSMIERREELEIKASDCIPKEWEAVIAACLHKDPSLRPPSAGKLLELLGLKSGSLAGTNATTQPFITPKSKAAVKSRSHAPVYAAAAVAVLAAGAAFYFKSTTPGAPAVPPPAKATAGNSPAPAQAPPPPPARSAAPVPPAAPAVAAAAPAPQTPSATLVPGAPVAVAAPAGPGPASPAVVPSTGPSAPNVASAAPGSPAMPAGPAGSVPPVPGALPPPAPGPGTAAAPAVAASPGSVPPAAGAPPALAQGIPPAVAASLPPGAMVQPPVSEPPQGFWPLAAIFPTPPQASYSESGRRHLLYDVQGLLKEKSIYSSAQDGKEGKGTHNAIILYQAKHGLVPNGLLDGPTLASMSLIDKPDDPDWKAPSSSGGSGSSQSGFRRRPQSQEEPNLFQRAGKSIGRFFNRD
ncbi:serine/threonine-protein kinase [Prosthecobacter sp.]|uniref:serine/threonine-protein kinase n=1 Tax=Prosthecobacter sp. TaxID=1965333 RepID=UPI003783429D